MQYSKQAHKIMTSTDKKILFFFLTKLVKTPISRISGGITSIAPPIFSYGLVFIILIQITYIFLRKTYVLWNLPCEMHDWTTDSTWIHIEQISCCKAHKPLNANTCGHSTVSDETYLRLGLWSYCRTEGP